MGTYYQYADRRVEDQIDWGKLGLDVSNSLRAERDLREKKKEDIDNETRKVTQAISDIPVGENNNLNTLAADAADLAQNQLLMADRLFKAGQLGQREYMTQRANINDGMTNMFGMIKGWNEVY